MFNTNSMKKGRLYAQKTLEDSSSPHIFVAADSFDSLPSGYAGDVCGESFWFGYNEEMINQADCEKAEFFAETGYHLIPNDYSIQRALNFIDIVACAEVEAYLPIPGKGEFFFRTDNRLIKEEFLDIDPRLVTARLDNPFLKGAEYDVNVCSEFNTLVQDAFSEIGDRNITKAEFKKAKNIYRKIINEDRLLVDKKASLNLVAKVIAGYFEQTVALPNDFVSASDFVLYKESKNIEINNLKADISFLEQPSQNDSLCVPG